MIPIKLQIEGFLSYQSPATINFETIHLACISGSNGAGKSSILDAITWVLFGIGRSRNDEVINQNSKVATVIYVFGYESQTYQILRSKEREKPLILELNIFDEKENRWKVFTEHSSAETQKRIISILRLDYDTFVNASFFLQGKADMFTVLKPSERKEILASILGLEIWETYRITAREKYKSLELDQKRISGILEEIETEIKQEESIKSELNRLQSDLKTKNETKIHLTLLLEQAKRVAQARQNLIQQVHSQENEIKKLTQKLEFKQQSVQEIGDQIEQFQSIVENETQIKVDFEKWKDLRNQLEKLEELKDTFYNLDKQKLSLQNKINKKTDDIKNHLRILDEEALKFEQNKTSLQNLLHVLEKTRVEITITEKDLSILPNLITETENSQAILIQKKEELKQLISKNDELREHLKAFQKAGPDCPFCKLPLTEEHKFNYENQLKNEGVERKIRIDLLEPEIQNIQDSINRIKTDIADKNAVEKKRQFLEIEKSKLETQVKNLEKLVIEWENSKAPEQKKHKILLEDGSFAETEKSDLDQILLKISELAYDSQLHSKCKENEIHFRSSENKMRELEKAKSAILPLSKQKVDLELEIDELKNEYKEKHSQVNQLNETLKNEFNETFDSIQLQKQEELIQIEINQMNSRIGGEQQKLESITKKKGIKEIKLQEKNTNSQAIARYKKLEDAFSKNGIPALLIEQALPQIEEHANTLLERLTNGAMSIRFETQIEYKDKKRQDKKETLDIKINDLYGNSRSYEMFSGGEAFRINFAIRIALSQVLASRSGAKLQTLVIDEGFGSQDSEGRQRLIDVIGRIKNDFAKILIITHLDELKDVFPVRIEVEKTNHGSQISVQAA